MGVSTVQSFVIWSSLAACAVLAGLTFCGRTFQSMLVSFGLMTASAWMVDAAGGTIEVHFHYFALLPFLAFYQMWSPFLLAIGYVGIQHGIGGVFWPHHIFASLSKDDCVSVLPANSVMRRAVWAIVQPWMTDSI